MTKKILAISLLLLLTGCGTPLGMFLGAIGSSTVSFVSKSVQDDIAQAAVWRAGHHVIVSQCTTSLMRGIDDLTEGDFEKTLARCNTVLEFSAAQQPQILAVRLKGHYERAKAKNGIKE